MREVLEAVSHLCSGKAQLLSTMDSTSYTEFGSAMSKASSSAHVRLMSAVMSLSAHDDTSSGTAFEICKPMKSCIAVALPSLSQPAGMVMPLSDTSTGSKPCEVSRRSVMEIRLATVLFSLTTSVRKCCARCRSDWSTAKSSRCRPHSPAAPSACPVSKTWSIWGVEESMTPPISHTHDASKTLSSMPWKTVFHVSARRLSSSFTVFSRSTFAFDWNRALWLESSLVNMHAHMAACAKHCTNTVGHRKPTA
mmetsp:Transcript_70597/g.182036  ORF Transcript_70597/g.182036 Transcript_70597/m.182036 type:complete len:251 (-) Transcript_70597:597-1349(-)